ncbi:related to bifunctional 4-hydroxyphenylacetate degradation enzyme [Rhynchosporium graminicola]|uniref:Related to bifunctional 4-hydroxyphenylacetate degradation enzyme n=1 Tax=Rhynchosporium graminicola TaxID=2792576 RepID=A0A1E1KFQ4_9HELO|nr:related to bifunctional 4-hydroxyphenylacetate degradation enzyme [Rhynchosporium commune]
MSIPSFGRLVRFVPKSGSVVLIGEPTDKTLDIGAATLAGKDVEVSVFSGSSVLSPGSSTGKTEVIGRVLSPLAESEVGTIRCIGLNYVQHAREAKMALPDVPVLFTKPSTALADPYPAPTIIPKHTLKDDSCDYESELVIVIGKKCKNVIEAEVLEYVLGYTASNDVSSRTSQFAQSQWSFSKGFDGACPIGPVIVSKELIPDVGKLHLRGLKNGRVMQDCGLDDLIFSVPKIVSFLSQGTTLNSGTIILTGTPAGVGLGSTPKEYLHEGDEFSVEILPYIGTLVTKFEAEK